MYNLFSRFPIISFNGSLARNIFVKIKMSDVLTRLSAVFYPYTIMEGERPDVIAANYYGDARYSWLVYMANDILDPYYEWPLTTDQFDQFIVAKYGSITEAIERIAYWKDNGASDETILTVSAYDALTSSRKKYYKPIVGYNNQPVNYERSNLSLSVETNMTIKIDVANSALFEIGQSVTQKTLATTTGSGFIKLVGDNNIVVQNVQGAFANTAGNVHNIQSNTASSAVSNVTIINRAIPEDEAIFWTPVSCYDYEADLNNEKRFIRLIDKSYVDQIEKELSQLL